MEITNRDRFWMNCKVAQAWRFVVLNLQILKAADHGKQAPPAHPQPHARVTQGEGPRMAIPDVPGR